MDYKPLLTLLAIIPFFIHYTQDFTRAQRRRTIWITSFSAFMVIATSALLGLQILDFLDFFGISLASFQVGGGPGGRGGSVGVRARFRTACCRYAKVAVLNRDLTPKL